VEQRRAFVATAPQTISAARSKYKVTVFFKFMLRRNKEFVALQQIKLIF
jgi:hypothetical protein